MSRKTQQERTDREQTKFWVRVVCIVLAFLMIGSSLFAALGLF